MDRLHSGCRKVEGWYLGEEGPLAGRVGREGNLGGKAHGPRV